MLDPANRSRLNHSISCLYELVSKAPTVEPEVVRCLTMLLQFLNLDGSEGESESARERSRVDEFMRGFDPATSAAGLALAEHFGSDMTLNRLREFAARMTARLGRAVTPLERIHKRRKSVLIKWFDENWTAIEPMLAAEGSGPANAATWLNDVQFDWDGLA
jgi:hypothetical protein